MSELAAAETVLVELPCGYLHEGELKTDARITPMTGRVRKMIARPDVRQNPARVLDTLLLECVQAVGPISPISKSVTDRMFLGDRDYLTLMIRKISMGNVVNAEMVCDNCKEHLDLQVDIDTLAVKKLKDVRHKIEEGGKLITFDVVDAELGINATFRFPTGEDQGAIAPLIRRNPIEASYRLYYRCLRSWGGKSASEFSASMFEELPVKKLDFVEREFVENQPGPDLRQPTTCPVCGNELLTSMEMSDFLFRLPRTAKT